jgi:hypothetical protein
MAESTCRRVSRWFSETGVYSPCYSFPGNNFRSMTLYLPVTSLIREVLMEKDLLLTCTEGRPPHVGKKRPLGVIRSDPAEAWGHW